MIIEKKKNSAGEVSKANMFDYNLLISKYEFQMHYYNHFWTYTFEKGMKSLISPVIG